MNKAIKYRCIVCHQESDSTICKANPCSVNPYDEKSLLVETCEPIPQGVENFKRFILFEYDYYYPQGGMSDVSGSFNTVEEALEVAKNYEAFQIFDCTQRAIIFDKR